MNISRLSLPIVLACFLACCAGEIVTPPTPLKRESPSHKQSYDPGRGGIQITAIYYDQKANQDTHGLAVPDEWIVIESNRNVSTQGWILDASDGQLFDLPSSINGRLVVFTQQGDVPDSVIGAGAARMVLGRKSWIWNNTTPDTARIYDDKGVEVHRLTYEAK